LRPYLGNISGGLSGPAVKPLALRAVYELFESVTVPIVGMGGVADAQDVLEFMACGAAVVAVGSCALRDPCLGQQSARGLANLLDDRGLSLPDLVGLGHRQA